MKKEELRIGNWVDSVYNIPYIKITEIKNSIVCGINCKGMSYGSLKPIPLSEEVLLKCGAREYNRSEYSIKYEIDTKTHHINILYKKNRILVFFGMCYLTDIKHLHQLQNIYFALTQTELEVSL